MAAAWSKVSDLSELDADLRALGSNTDNNNFYFATFEVAPQELLALARAQLRAKQGGRWLNLYRRSLLGLPLLPEGSAFARFWRRLMMLIDLTYTTFYIPLTLALFSRYGTQTYEATVLFAVDCATGAFFAANMLQQLHVPVRVSAGFYQLLVVHGQGIAYVYKTQGTFWLDLATMVPWLMQLVVPFLAPTPARSIASVMMLLRLLRLLRVVSLVKQLARGDLAPHSNGRFMSVGTGYMLSLVFSAMASINLLACVWYLAGSVDAHGYEAGTWWEAVGGRDLTGAPVWDRYLAALYFTVTTITTTGYGDITARNNVEMVVAIFIMLAGALFMSVIIGTVAALINSTSADAQRSQAFREKAQYLDRFFDHVPIDRGLQKDVYEFYYYAYAACKQEQEEWEHVVGELPSSLRGVVVLALLRRSCRGLMQQLGAGVPDSVMLELCSCLERQVAAPGTTLAALGSAVDQLWLLRHGTLLALRPSALLCPEFSQLMALVGSPAPPWRRQASPAAGAAPGRSMLGCCCVRPVACRPEPEHATGQEKLHQQQQQQHNEEAEEQQQQPRDVELGAWQQSSPSSHPHLATLQSSASSRAIAGAAASPGPQQESSCSSSWPKDAGGPGHKPGSRSSLLQALQRQGHVDVLAGPCLLPACALLPAKQPPANQPQAAELLWQDQPHPVWLRTFTPCVVFSADLAIVRGLCEVCPQLQHNLMQLLQQQQQQ